MISKHIGFQRSQPTAEAVQCKIALICIRALSFPNRYNFANPVRSGRPYGLNRVADDSGSPKPGEHRKREIKMSRIALHHPHGTDFDRFLYATVGADRNGYVVTVLSTLARLGLDPWKEASELGALSQDVARSRLGALLASFSDVPTLVLEHASTAERLTRLLPEHAHRPSESPGSLAARESSISRGTIITIVIILLLLAQIYGLGTSGTGD